MSHENEQSEISYKGQTTPAFAGIYVAPKVRITIPNVSEIFQAIQEGRVPNVTLHTKADMSIFWLPIAIEHFKATEIAHLRLIEVIEARIDDQIGNQLLAEFTSALQVFTSVAFAFDAFQAMIRTQIELPEEKVKGWIKNGTSWAKQTNEVLNIAFTISKVNKPLIEKIITNIADFRNDAVHTKALAQPPVYHEDLGSHTEWRLVKYSYRNAKECMIAAMSIFAYLPTKPKSKYKVLVEYCEDFIKVMQPTINEWKELQVKVNQE